ncbi:VOC family protein [Ornithinimicrobium cavernae]|uniref:VOC family protein n=1 Tax=Ornithinimicrobium cavernae TaxID=2666047 RepID=UPI000D697376|nr:VOC family protein [Ornithinimicrobium cavernae]
MSEIPTSTESTNTPQTLSAKQFQEVSGTEHWRVLGAGAAAWFSAASHGAGAELAVRAVDAAAESGRALETSIRSLGVHVRLPLGPTDGGFTQEHADLARAVSAAAEELGLEADPAALQDVQLTMDTMDQAAVLPFWEAALGYDPVGDEDLLDRFHRHPPIWFQDQDAPRPLRNRVHLDSVMPQKVATETLAALRERGASSVAEHGYYATVADAEGNEVDVLPLPEGSDRWERPGTEDWRLVFSAMACYPVGTVVQGTGRSTGSAAAFVQAVAALADEAGLPLGIDVRPAAAGQSLVVLDSGKDRWEMTEGYEALAARVQETARGMGLTADVAAPRFVQIGIDAVDLPAVREFWRAALGYEEDPRAHVTDIVDPHQVNVPLFLQGMDAGDEARRAQRNRIHVDLFLPHDQLRARLEAALAAGGTVVRDAGPISWTVTDPEGNEIDLTTAYGREEHWAAQQG